jgi:hypothetical protein
MTLAMIVSLSAAILSLISADSHVSKIEILSKRLKVSFFSFRMRVGKYSVSAREVKRTTERSDSTGNHVKTIADRRASNNLWKEMH